MPEEPAATRPRRDRRAGGGERRRPAAEPGGRRAGHDRAPPSARWRQHERAARRCDGDRRERRGDPLGAPTRSRRGTSPAQVAALAAQMRAHGARVGLGEVLSAQRALAAVDAADRAEVFYALRASLCSTRAELPRSRPRSRSSSAPTRRSTRSTSSARSPSRRCRGSRSRPPATRRPRSTSCPRPPRGARRSCCARRTSRPTPTPSARRRAGCSPGSRARGPTRRSRRTLPTKRRRDEHDLRATVRASLRHGGELLERRYREQAERPRRLVLICDVSGSMAPYSRMLLQYMQACVAARARVEAFAFGTRLTRVTRELRGRDSDRALAPRRRRGQRLVRRHPDRRGDRRAQPRARPPDRPRLDGHPALRRLGPRRARGARGGDGAARPHRPPRSSG